MSEKQPGYKQKQLEPSQQKLEKQNRKLVTKILCNSNVAIKIKPISSTQVSFKEIHSIPKHNEKFYKTSKKLNAAKSEKHKKN